MGLIKYSSFYKVTKKSAGFELLVRQNYTFETST